MAKKKKSDKFTPKKGTPPKKIKKPREKKSKLRKPESYKPKQSSKFTPILWSAPMPPMPGEPRVPIRMPPEMGPPRMPATFKREKIPLRIVYRDKKGRVVAAIKLNGRKYVKYEVWRKRGRDDRMMYGSKRWYKRKRPFPMLKVLAHLKKWRSFNKLSVHYSPSEKAGWYERPPGY